MADIKWTKEQLDVIETHNCNLLVAAAAGSGKTAVLVERIIQIIMDEKNPIDIDRLLVVTFTNAAASEMRERIGDALSKEIGKGKNAVRLQRQLTLLNRASITTIHSFCLNVIKNNFHKIDIDPGFRVADETEVVLLKQEALEELFEHKYDNSVEINEEEGCSGEDFLRLVETYCTNRDDLRLMELVLRIYNFANTAPNPKKWLEENSEKFNVRKFNSIEDSDWIRILKNTLLVSLQGAYMQYCEAYNLVQESIELEPYEELIKDELAMINDLVQSLKVSFIDFIREIQEVKFKKLPTIRNVKDKNTKDKIQGIRNDIKKQIEALRQDYGEISNENVKESYEYIYPIIKNLSILVMQFSTIYKRKKKEKGIIDFNDFEHFCLEILVEKDEKNQWVINEKGKYVPSGVALELREKYDEILIDEYQDSNFVQELLLNMVSKVSEGKPNVFMVGDIKQSIYRFRQAKPELFLEKYNNYSSEKGSGFRKILLFKNFRSRKEILDGVNFIFTSIMSEQIGELDYNENEALNLGADYEEIGYKEGFVGGDIELHLLEKNEEEAETEVGIQIDDDSEEVESTTDMAYEARITAYRIKEFIENNENPFMVLDKHTKEYRRVKYKDIVILLRSTASVAGEFMEEFKKYNIPAYADISTGYFETTEIKTILSLLQIIDNPIQDIPLLAIMKSPIGGFSPDDFISIRIDEKHKSFYDACKDYIKNNDNKLSKKLDEFFYKLDSWIEKSLYTPIDEFIWFLYMETGYYGFVGALPNGIQRQANLKVLFQRARQYENTSYKGLFNFINFINRLKNNSGDMGSAKILGENDDVVRIMSIHKSKGLEFPIVFLCGIGKKFNLQDLNSNLLLHHELGFGPDLIDYKRRISYPLPIKKAIKEKILMETISEEMRILYVALTRAKEKLILVGGTRNIVNFIERTKNRASFKNEKVAEYSIAKCRSYLDWIMISLINHSKFVELLKVELNRVFEIEQEFENNIDDNSKWNFKIWNKGELEDLKLEDEKDRGEVLRNILNQYNVNDELIENNVCKDNQKHIDNKIYDFINSRLTYEYMYSKAEELPTVLTVSELKRRFNVLEQENSQEVVEVSLVKRPSFMEGKKKLTAAERGTAFHAIMQYIDFAKVKSIEDVKSEIFRIYSKELITEEESNSVDPNRIFMFFKDKLGNKIVDSIPNVYREIEFHIPLKAIEVFPELKDEIYKEEEILLQGIIDCYFETRDGEVILLDYKTDYIEQGEEEKIVRRYKLQLDYYEKALEILTGKKVKEKYLYLFSLNKSIRL
ncbi:helicase-exonuclease AddAB subunit AddA [Clostridiaceae bacterium 14S0207]|nr:helicase-exonuclease AddAB subunit AddA [Clostridiaceae bacterium 14S0207]